MCPLHCRAGVAFYISTNPMKLFACCSTLLFVSTAAWGQQSRIPASCSAPVVQAVAKSAAINKLVSEDDVISAACKPWPYDQSRLLSAFAFDTGVKDEKTFVVAIVDTNTNKVVSTYKTRVEEDAAVEFGSNSLTIDTARYQLSGNLRAFGVRFTSAARGASCADAIFDDELSLFASTSSGLRPLLVGLAMTHSMARSGCFGNSGKKLVYDQAKLFLAPTTSSSHGLNDLMVTARISRESGDMHKDAAKTERYLLRYDGKTYAGAGQVPWWLFQMPLGE